MTDSVVVLLHGLWMHGAVMEPLRHRLIHDGYAAKTYSYPSVRLSLTENAERLAQFAQTLDAPTIHWVGHSMGGLVILRMLQQIPHMLPGRVVLMGTPYRGSAASRVLADNTLGAQVLGRSMREWLESESPSTFDHREIGVIAGSLQFGLGHFLAPDLLTPNDGVVAVEETHLTAACDRVVLPVSHTGMLLSQNVADQIHAFLRDGHFEHTT